MDNLDARVGASSTNHVTRLLRRWPILLLGLLAGLALGFGATFAIAPSYSASTLLIVRPAESESIAEASAGDSLARGTAGTLVQLSTSDAVAQRAWSALGVANRGPAALADVQVQGAPESPLLSIVASRQTQAEAAHLAQAWADATIAESRAVIPSNAAGDELLSVAQVGSISSSDTPAGPPSSFVVLAGALTGLVLGGVLAFLLPNRGRNAVVKSGRIDHR